MSTNRFLTGAALKKIGYEIKKQPRPSGEARPGRSGWSA